jgi:hypothetical protein
LLSFWLFYYTVYIIEDQSYSNQVNFSEKAPSTFHGWCQALF